MNVIEVFVGFALAAAVIGFVVIVAAMILDEIPESPLRRWRKLRTPPCRLCEHYAKDGCVVDICACPAAVELEEKLTGSLCFNVRSKNVRGTRVCVFEPKKGEE